MQGRQNDILSVMNILIAPFIAHTGASAAYDLTANLISLFSASGHPTALSAPEDSHFNGASLYPCAEPKHPFSLIPEEYGSSFEAELHRKGLLSRDFLERDFNDLTDIIHSFKPDLLIAIDRPSAIAAAFCTGTRVWTLTSDAVERRSYFPPVVLKAFNLFLSSHGIEQILSLAELYERCQLRFAFGNPGRMTFLQNPEIYGMGTALCEIPRVHRTNRVCVYLEDLSLSAHRIRRLITDSFVGAPYAVQAWYPGCRKEKVENIHFNALPDSALVPGCSAILHTGSCYLFDAASVCGIPQVILHHDRGRRMWMGDYAKHQNIGLALSERKLNMDRLYSTYRQLLNDDIYYESCQVNAAELQKAGTLQKLLKKL